MSGYRKGRDREYRAQRILEAAGYTTTRAAGSKGAADLIAWDSQRIRFISVKAGTKYASAIEREALMQLPKPSNATCEIWRFPDRAKEPLIEVVS